MKKLDSEAVDSLQKNFKKLSLDQKVELLKGEQHGGYSRKLYWFGYSDEMYAVASHGDAALPSLKRLLREPADEIISIRALLTVHLIGIRSNVVGRFTEEFKSKKARQVIISQLIDKGRRELALKLLMRDPWGSDRPALVDLLKKEEVPCPLLVDALFRYAVKDIPFRKSLNQQLNIVQVYLESNKKVRRRIGRLQVFHREKAENRVSIGNSILNKGVVVRWADEGRVFMRFVPAGEMNKKEVSRYEHLLYDFLRWSDKSRSSTDGYLGPENKLWHYIDGDSLVIVDEWVAKARWLKYFKTITAK